MNTIIQIVRHTPIWVLPLIAGVLWLGSISLRERTVSLRQLPALPVVMMMLSIGNALGTAATAVVALVVWLFFTTIGGAIGWRLTQRPLAIDPDLGRMTLPGTMVPLVICIAIVVLRYSFGYLYGRYPELRADQFHALTLIAGGALLAGVMFGRCVRLGRCYWMARSGWMASA
jgi:hypothetical protein